MLLEILWAAGSTLAFGIIFNLKGKKLFFASVGGALGWAVYVLAKNSGSSIPASFLFSSIAITIYSEIIARILKTPVTSTLIASLIPLVPGSGVYFTMSYLVENKIEEAVEKGTETILVTVAITVGIVLVSTFSQIYYKIRRYNKIKKKIYMRNSTKTRKQINKF